MPIDNKTPKWRHQLTLVDREELAVDGVSSLGSYDEKEVVMETEQGILTITGEGLNIKQLNLEQGNIVIEGTVKGLTYEDEARQRKGLLERFLK
ncbi:sporulation protein YabP [Sporomusa sphaeroides]|uniref:Spore protein YabP n=2 Tax=Sporomusa TaxID=2375 RepID=A0ABM9W3X9_9FIRM|nr:sporulation protein YabP [Sporomusa sphaeroides]OLS56847.1 spore protein YabP [Sporomusa sphaeroides DSM 2875]CVK18794.1 Spore protein YabP [Sporomusa sphaeroides DSM 2875]SCM81884.1 Sporulation protein YabP/YqfC [uncultured Sporomusa sp.]